MPYSRRVFLGTIGVVSAGCVVGCGGGGDGGVPQGTATMCGANLCVSIAANPELAEVGGGLLFRQAAGHSIYVVKTSATAFAVVSAICTHANCTVEWTGSLFECPCHASQFSPDGVATRGPAMRPLRAYTHMLDGDTLTIVVG